MATTVLVCGATGNVGRSVVRELQGTGAQVRAFVRNPESAARTLPTEIEWVIGDFSDASSIERAMEGAQRVFLASADGPLKVEHEGAVIEAAAASGVERIVKASTIGARPGSPLPPFDWHGRIEEHLQRSGLPAIILHSSFYMTNLLLAAGQIRGGSLPAPAGEGRVGMIDPADVGAAAAAILIGGDHDGHTYTLTGPEAITYEEIANALTDATGHPVRFVNVPDPQARQALLGAGMPDWLVQHLSGLFGLIRGGALAETTDTIMSLTGRKPRSFRQFAHDHAALFRGDA